MGNVGTRATTLDLFKVVETAGSPCQKFEIGRGNVRVGKGA
jgi:hypothetical protein